jgi:hypothetical protein
MKRLAEFGYLRVVALVLVGVVAITYGLLAVRWQRATDTELQRITRVVEGTPGKPGEPGEPGVGVNTVLVHTLPAGSDPRATLRHGLLSLWIPLAANGTDGRIGPRGRQGPIGRQGPPGKAGRPGESVSTKQLQAFVESFLRSHTFRCKRDGDTFTCRIS